MSEIEDLRRELEQAKAERALIRSKQALKKTESDETRNGQDS
jgi:hypothetical protein